MTESPLGIPDTVDPTAHGICAGMCQTGSCLSCSVRTFTATEISIGQASTVQPAEGKWVDVGQEHLSIAILLPDLDQDSDDPPPDILDVVYSKSWMA